MNRKPNTATGLEGAEFAKNDEAIARHLKAHPEATFLDSMTAYELDQLRRAAYALTDARGAFDHLLRSIEIKGFHKSADACMIRDILDDLDNGVRHVHLITTVL